MRRYLLFVFLGVTSLGYSQKIHRHELTLGYYGGYFCDETPFRLQARPFVYKRLPTVTYTYRWHRNLDAYILYGAHSFGYFKDLDVVPSKAVFARVIRHYAVHVGGRFLLKNMHLRLFSGLSYRSGYRGRDLYTYDRGTWIEGYVRYDDYHTLGWSSGISLQHPIYWRFFGELSTNYIRYFSNFDQNLLMPGYKIGFRF